MSRSVSPGQASPSYKKTSLISVKTFNHYKIFQTKKELVTTTTRHFETSVGSNCMFLRTNSCLALSEESANGYPMYFRAVQQPPKAGHSSEFHADSCPERKGLRKLGWSWGEWWQCQIVRGRSKVGHCMPLRVDFGWFFGTYQNWGYQGVLQCIENCKQIHDFSVGLPKGAVDITHIDVGFLFEFSSYFTISSCFLLSPCSVLPRNIHQPELHPSSSIPRDSELSPTALYWQLTTKLSQPHLVPSRFPTKQLSAIGSSDAKLQVHHTHLKPLLCSEFDFNTSRLVRHWKAGGLRIDVHHSHAVELVGLNSQCCQLQSIVYQLYQKLIQKFFLFSLSW